MAAKKPIEKDIPEVGDPSPVEEPQAAKAVGYDPDEAERERERNRLASTQG